MKRRNNKEWLRELSWQHDCHGQYRYIGLVQIWSRTRYTRTTKSYIALELNKDIYVSLKILEVSAREKDIKSYWESHDNGSFLVSPCLVGGSGQSQGKAVNMWFITQHLSQKKRQKTIEIKKKIKKKLYDIWASLEEPLRHKMEPL